MFRYTTICLLLGLSLSPQIGWAEDNSHDDQWDPPPRAQVAETTTAELVPVEVWRFFSDMILTDHVEEKANHQRAESAPLVELK